MSFETCNEVDIMQLYSSSIQKYNNIYQCCLSDCVHQFLEWCLIFATCKRNYVFLSKNLFLVLREVCFISLMAIFDASLA